jgi:hypothetical protein
MYLQKVKMTKVAGFGSESRSISQRHGPADPDPNQNVMDPEHCQNHFTRTKNKDLPMVCESLLACGCEGAEVAGVLDPVMYGEAVEGQLVCPRTAVRAVLALESATRHPHA